MLLVAAQEPIAGIDSSARMCLTTEQTCLIFERIAPSISISKAGCLNQEKSQLLQYFFSCEKQASIS